MKNSNGKASAFLRKNALYLVLALCILAVGLSITFMLISRRNEEINNDTIIDTPVETEKPEIIEPDGPIIKPDIPDVEPVEKPVIFIMPVNNATAINGYSETMVFNNTLGHFATHKAIDFFAEEGAPVMAVYDGKIKSIESTLLKGFTITIDHGNGLLSIYNSLLDGDNVTVGQNVKQGDIIGEVSVSNRQECKDGAHLHFEVMENEKIIDPSKYLVFEEK